MMLEALAAENMIARWFWKSGEVKKPHSVPWEVQQINTNPEVFVWESETTHITVTTAGLYEITFGFYCRKKPTV